MIMNLLLLLRDILILLFIIIRIVNKYLIIVYKSVTPREEIREETEESEKFFYNFLARFCTITLLINYSLLLIHSFYYNY